MDRRSLNHPLHLIANQLLIRLNAPCHANEIIDYFHYHIQSLLAILAASWQIAGRAPQLCDRSVGRVTKESSGIDRMYLNFPLSTMCAIELVSDRYQVQYLGTHGDLPCTTTVWEMPVR